MRTGIILVLCGVLSVLSGCAPDKDVPPAAETPAEVSAEPSASSDLLTINENDYPRVDGSTATIPLGEAVAAVLTGKPRAECSEYAEFTGTDSAYRRLLNKEADLLIVYGASESTKTEFSENGNSMDDVFNFASIGADALVFLVNANNPVDSLTVEQLRGIYSGEITNWSEVGGEDAEIAAFQRNKTAGSQAMIESLLMDGIQMSNPREDYVAETMGGLITAVSDFDTGQYAIGYNVFYYVTEMKDDPNVKMLAIDGVLPDKDAIKQGLYPLVSDFYAVIRKDEPKDSAAALIFDWLQGGEGQALVDLEGYAAKNAD